jgi:hypothetical protein
MAAKIGQIGSFGFIVMLTFTIMFGHLLPLSGFVFLVKALAV